MVNKIKYEYYLKTWGGFYNKEHEHGYKEGDYYFDSKEERDNYIEKLHLLEVEYPNAKHLMLHLDQGYHLRTITTMHRVIRFEGKEYYSESEIWPGYDYDTTKYNLEWKWRPGFNDYPLGEDFDYSKVEIVQEWISGKFDINTDER